jgi:hypothetical protein
VAEGEWAWSEGAFRTQSTSLSVAVERTAVAEWTGEAAPTEEGAWIAGLWLTADLFREGREERLQIAVVNMSAV